MSGTARRLGTGWSDVRAVRHGGLRLADVVSALGGAMRYQAAARAVKRFGATAAKDRARARFVAAIKRHLSLILI